jgi:hypothetical protein
MLINQLNVRQTEAEKEKKKERTIDRKGVDTAAWPLDELE